MCTDNRMSNMGSENLYNIIVLTQLRKLHKKLILGILTPNNCNAGKGKYILYTHMEICRLIKLLFPCPCPVDIPNKEIN